MANYSIRTQMLHRAVLTGAKTFLKLAMKTRIWKSRDAKVLILFWYPDLVNMLRTPSWPSSSECVCGSKRTHFFMKRGQRNGLRVFWFLECICLSLFQCWVSFFGAFLVTPKKMKTDPLWPNSTFYFDKKIIWQNDKVPQNVGKKLFIPEEW